MLTSLTPMLETKDLSGTKEFYVSTLNFEVDGYDESFGWMSLKKDNISIMFAKPNEHRIIPESIMSGSLYINADNVDDLWENLKDKTKVCYPIETFDYGMREFAIFDNNGYLLQFGKSIKD